MMTKIIVLPHPTVCPDGAVIDPDVTLSICANLLKDGIALEHACEMSCACTTCHLVIREGFDALAPSDELEDDLLDKAWGLEPTSRLGCQAFVPVGTDVVVEIPRYTINHAKEAH